MSAPIGTSDDGADLRQHHLRWGWWTLLVFLSMGLVLEALHGFKLDWYLGVSSETRRLLLRLAHAHGTLLGLLHLALASTLRSARAPRGAAVRLASRALVGATLLLPGGFLLGGCMLAGGDPGRAVLLVPCGAVLLLAAAGLALRSLRAS